MPKKNPEREAKRQRHKELTEFLDSVGVSDVAGVQALFKDLVSSVLQNGLEGALEEELGYSKYDYRNKETDNSRNGYSEKTVRSSFGDIELSVPRDRKGDYEPQLIKKHQTSLSDDIEEKILSMYAKGMTSMPQKADEQFQLRRYAQGQKHIACGENQVRQVRSWPYAYSQYGKRHNIQEFSRFRDLGPKLYAEYGSDPLNYEVDFTL